MSKPDGRTGVARIETLAYRGKNYDVPIFDTEDPVVLRPRPSDIALPSAAESPLIRCLNSTWNLAEFEIPRRPISLGTLSSAEITVFSQPEAVRVLDLPIKMPDIGEYRLPRALRQFAGALQRIVDVEHRLNPQHADYHAYLTIDQRWVEPGTLHREAPCHVDGFQGARWNPKCLTNHNPPRSP